MIFQRAIRQIIFLMGVLLVSLTLIAQACDVPVYRYALERWPASLYEVRILHEGLLSKKQQEVVEWIDQYSSEHRPESNFQIRLLDIENPSNVSAKELWNEIGQPALPCFVLYYPEESGIERPVWSGPLTLTHAQEIVDSPLRRALAQRLLEEDSVVWIFVESGNEVRDEAARNLLNTQLAKQEKTLKLPEAVSGNFMKTFGVSREEEPSLQIQFSTLNLSRNDPTEAVFSQMLLSSEPDLIEYATQPMAFPVYGRGRALYALVGLGITEENIEEACRFLTGPCACEVKAQNPGMDLLLVVDWDAGIEFSAVSAIQDQPLVSLAAMAEAATPNRMNESSELSIVEINEKPEIEQSHSLLVNILILVGILFIIDIILIFGFFRRRRKETQ